MSFNFNINGSVLTPKGEQYPAANYGAGMRVSASFNGTWDGYVYRYCFIVSGDKTYLFKMTKGDNDTWTTDLSGRGVSGTVINISFYGTKNEYPKNNDTANPRMTTNALMIHLDDSLAGHITPSTNIDKSLASDILNAINTAENNSSAAGAAAHNAEEFAKQAESSAQRAKDQADASARSAKASSDSATASGNSASYANERAVASQKSADASATSANAASASADTSKIQAQESARQAGIATQKAKDATDQADRAKAQADEATRQAGIATADVAETKKQVKLASDQADRSKGEADRSKSEADRSTEQANRSETQANASEKSAKNAGISAAAALSSQQKAKTSEDNAKASETEATRQAGIATAQATEATKQAGIATAQAGEAKKQATTATTKAQEASTSAQSAKTSAQEATHQAETATAQATEATKQVKIATTKAQEASTSATNAKASETKSQGLVDEAHKWHDEIMANIQSAKDNADVAVRQADRAKSEANRAESSAHNAMLSEKNAKESADKADSIKHFVEENVEKTTQQATAAEEAKNKAIEAKDQALSYRDEINSHLDEANDLHNKAMVLDKQAQASAKASADSATASANSAKASAQSAKDAKDTASKTLTQATEIADGAVKTKKEVADLLSQTKASESEASKYAQQSKDSATASKASQDEATHQATLAKNNRDEVFANIARAETGADMAMEQAEEATRQADIATEAAKKARDYKVTVENLYDPITQTAEQAIKDAKKASDGVATINQSKADVAEMKETVLASQLDVETNKEIVKGLLAKTQQSEANAKASETAAKESETNAKTSETNTATMENHVGEMQTNVTNMQTNVTNMQTNVSGMKNDVSQMKQDVIGLKDNVSSMKDDVTQLKADTIALKNQVTTARNETETFKTQAGTSASAAATSESNTKKAEANVTQMKTDVSKMKDDVTQLKSDTATIKAQADETKSAIETLKTATETSAKNASDSATAAAQSATNAKTSETNAIDKATEATTQAGKAKTSAETATSQATIATTKAGEASTSAGEAKTQATIATTKAGEASTSATAAAGSAKSASDTKTAIDQEKVRIDKAVDKLENLKIGGRNYFLNSGSLESAATTKTDGITLATHVDTTTPSGDSLEVVYPPSKNQIFYFPRKQNYENTNILKGDKILFSIFYKGSGNTSYNLPINVEFIDMDAQSTYKKVSEISTGWKRAEIVGIANKDLIGDINTAITFRFAGATEIKDKYSLFLSSPKLEIGNQPTDWTPAPEDVDASISNVANIENTHYSTMTTQYNNQQKTIEGTVTRLGKAEDRITTVSNDLSNLSIGGRNLYLNTSPYRENSPFVKSGTGTDIFAEHFNGKTIYSVTKLAKGTEVVVQAKSNLPWTSVHGGSANNKNRVGMWFYECSSLDNAKIPKYTSPRFLSGDNKSTYMVWKIKANSDCYPAFRFNVYSDGTDTVTGKVWDIKLELGNKPTDWSPAPEDFENAITEMKTDVSKMEDTAPNENLISWNRVMNRNCFAAKFDYKTKVWTTWATKGDDTFGYGLFTSGGAHSWVLPYGESITYSFEVKPSERLKWQADVNSIAQSALGTDYTGNDIDNYPQRVYRKNGIKILTDSEATMKVDSYLEPNKWTKCSFTFSNTYADRNKNKVSIADDNVNFGVVTDSLDVGEIVTVQYRNIKVEYGDKPTRFIGYKQEDNGGENFIKNSGSLGNARMSYAGTGSLETYAGAGYDKLVPSGRYLKFTANDSGISTFMDKWNYEDINLQAGESVTLSIYMKTDCDDSLSIDDIGLNFGAEFMNCWLNDNQLTNSWKRFILTGIANKDLSSKSPWDGSAITFYFPKFPKGKSLYISSPKLERGSVATAWSESSIDNDKRVENLLKLIFNIAGPQELTKDCTPEKGKALDDKGNLIVDGSRSTIRYIGLFGIRELYALSSNTDLIVAGKTTGNQYSVDVYFITGSTTVIGKQTINSNVTKSPFIDTTSIDRKYVIKMLSLGAETLAISYKDNNDTQVRVYYGNYDTPLSKLFPEGY